MDPYEAELPYLNNPENWDFLYESLFGPRINFYFEGDPQSWIQLKKLAVRHGLNPTEMLRFCLYLLLEGPGNEVAARERLEKYLECEGL